MTEACELRLVEDNLPAGGELRFPETAINRAIYVVHGSIISDGKEVPRDEGIFAHRAARITAGSAGAALWRWELGPSSLLSAIADGPGASHLKIAAPLASPAGPVLMRLDSVAFPPGGCALLHTHQGPGIRCLIEGGIRIDTHGASTAYGPGGAWFEAGPEPVFAEAASDRPSRFIRVMILPAALKGRSSIAYVRPEDKDKPKSQTYRVFLDAPIDLD